MKHEITAKRLRTALDNKGLRAQDLADRAGVNKASISHYLSGTHKPSNLTAGKMATVLDVNPLWLMGFEEDLIEANENYLKARQSYEVMLRHLLNTSERYANVNFTQEDVFQIIDYIDYIAERKKK